MKKSMVSSRRLSVCCARIAMRGHRPSANANGRSVILPDLMFLYSRQHHSQTLCVCSVMFSWTFAVAPLVAAPRLLKGRSVGKALPHFHSEPYVFRAGCRSAVRAFPCADIDRARTPKELRTACPPLAFLYSRQHHSQNAPRLLCDVFLNFPSARLTAAERRYMVAQSAKPSFASAVSLMRIAPYNGLLA